MGDLLKNTQDLYRVVGLGSFKQGQHMLAIARVREYQPDEVLWGEYPQDIFTMVTAAPREPTPPLVLTVIYSGGISHVQDS